MNIVALREGSTYVVSPEEELLSATGIRRRGEEPDLARAHKYYIPGLERIIPPKFASEFTLNSSYCAELYSLFIETLQSPLMRFMCATEPVIPMSRSYLTLLPLPLSREQLRSNARSHAVHPFIRHKQY